MKKFYRSEPTHYDSYKNAIFFNLNTRRDQCFGKYDDYYNESQELNSYRIIASHVFRNHSKQCQYFLFLFKRMVKCSLEI